MTTQLPGDNVPIVQPAPVPFTVREATATLPDGTERWVLIFNTQSQESHYFFEENVEQWLYEALQRRRGGLVIPKMANGTGPMPDLGADPFRNLR